MIRIKRANLKHLDPKGGKDDKFSQWNNRVIIFYLHLRRTL